MRTHWLVSLMIVAGCAVDEVDEIETTTYEQGINGICPPWMCLNSPEVLYNGLHELHLMGQANPQGYRLENGANGRALIFVGGFPYELYVENNRITAVGYGTQITGAGLIGAEMHVLRPDNSTLYNLRIDNVRPSYFPVPPNDPVEIYTLGWLSPGSGSFTKPACNGGTIFEEYSTYGMNTGEALIFVGDRIDGDRLTITPDYSNLWMTIGCAGHTLSKLHLTRNTTSSNLVPDWAGNQATLKLLAADYCGDGTPWTISGTPIRWMGGQVGYLNWPGQIEARWNEYGAVCFSEPRIRAPVTGFFSTPLVTKLKVRQRCMTVHHAIPPCTNTNVWDLAGAKRLSALPL